jgi:DNA-binding phage protein
MSAEATSAPYDAADYLETPEDIAAYLGAVIEEGDERVLLAALEDVSRAAQRIMPEESAIQPDGQAEPSLARITALLHTFGFELSLRRKRAA